MTPDNPPFESGLLNRTDWLKAHGFDLDPFLMNSFWGDKDQVLQEAFLEFNDCDFEKIKGPLKDGGYLFIFASAGGGKSSLRTRIKSELGPKAVPEESHVLVVEYIDHSYDMEQSDALSHVIRLKLLIEQILAEHNAGMVHQETADVKSARGLLLDAFAFCKAHGFDAVCILVDVDSEGDGSDSAFQRILPLASASSLFDIDRLIFKFLLPLEYKSAYGAMLARGNKYPLYEVTWNRERLRRSLEDRLVACQMQSEKASIYDPRQDGKASGVSLLAQLCTLELYGTIEEEFVRFGLVMGCPRAMWQLGYYLFEEHFNLSPNSRRRRENEKIERSALDAAYDRLSREVPSYATTKTQQLRMSACQRIENLITQGSVDALVAAVELFRLCNERAAIAMLARLNRAMKEYRLGLIEREKYDVTLNQITDNLLQQMELSVR